MKLLRYVFLTVKYGLAAFGAWLLLMELGRRLHLSYWQQTLNLP